MTMRFPGLIIMVLVSGIITAVSAGEKPEILSIDQVEVVGHDNYTFSLSFTVNYAGADGVNVEVEEEYNTTLRSYRFDEPSPARIRIGAITNQYYSWVTVKVTNSWGSDYRTMEFAPVGVGGVRPVEIGEAAPGTVGEGLVELYTLRGQLIFRGVAEDLRFGNFPAGLYIKRESRADGGWNVSKCSVR